MTLDGASDAWELLWALPDDIVIQTQQQPKPTTLRHVTPRGSPSGLRGDSQTTSGRPDDLLPYQRLTYDVATGSGNADRLAVQSHVGRCSGNSELDRSSSDIPLSAALSRHSISSWPAPCVPDGFMAAQDSSVPSSPPSAAEGSFHGTHAAPAPRSPNVVSSNDLTTNNGVAANGVSSRSSSFIGGSDGQAIGSGQAPEMGQANSITGPASKVYGCAPAPPAAAASYQDGLDAPQGLWTAEALRSLCRSRDPRLQALAGLRVPAGSQAPLAASQPPIAVCAAQPSSDAPPLTDTQPEATAPRRQPVLEWPSQPSQSEQPQPPQSSRPLQQPVLAQACPLPPLPSLPPLRRGGQTTTSRLLARLRPASANPPPSRPPPASNRIKLPVAAAAGRSNAAAGPAGHRGRSGAGGGWMSCFSDPPAVRHAGARNDANDGAPVIEHSLRSGLQQVFGGSAEARAAGALAERGAAGAARSASAPASLPLPGAGSGAGALPPLQSKRFDFSARKRRPFAPPRAEATAERSGQAGQGGEGLDGAYGSDGSGAGSGTEGATGRTASGRKRAAASSSAAAATPTAGDSGEAAGGADDDGGWSLEEMLREWRAARARSVRKTPVGLLRCGLVSELAARCPTSILALLDVPGLPRPWVRQFGQEVLDVCRNYMHVREARAAAAAAARRARRAAAASAAAAGATGAAAAGAVGGAGGVGAAAVERGGEGGAELVGRAAKRARVGEVQRASSPRAPLPPIDQASREQSQDCPRAHDDSFVPPSSGAQVTTIAGVAAQAPDRLFNSALTATDCAAAGTLEAPAVTATTTEQATGDPWATGAATIVTAAAAAVAEEPPIAAPANGAPGPSKTDEDEEDEPLVIPRAGGGAAGRRRQQGELGSGGGGQEEDGSGTSHVVELARAAIAAMRSGAKLPRSGHTKAPAPVSRAARGVYKAKAGRKPRAAARARKLVSTKVATAAAAEAAAAVRDGGWVPPPPGCRVRVGRQLALAPTPAVGAIRINDLLSVLAEAGRDAAPFFSPEVEAAAGGGSGGEATEQQQQQQEQAPPPKRERSRATGADAADAAAAAAAVPSAAVAAAEAVQALGRWSGQEHMRRLRAMALAALPAWEVRRVLACAALPAAEQAAAVLRLEAGASRDEVRVAFRRLSLVVHPDKNRSAGAAEAFALVSGAASKLLGS